MSVVTIVVYYVYLFFIVIDGKSPTPLAIRMEKGSTSPHVLDFCGKVYKFGLFLLCFHVCYVEGHFIIT